MDKLFAKNEWKEVVLGDLVDLIIDHRGKTPIKLGGDWSKSVGYRAISAKSIKKGRLVNEDQMNILPENLYKKWMKNEIQPGDIFLTSEAPLGEHLIWKTDEKLVLSQRVFGIRTNKAKLDPYFLNFFMDSDYFQHELKSRESGSTVRGIKQSELLKTKILVPSLAEQHSIAAVLSALDNKIELLREQNKTLEAIAQNLFHEWFVEFNFPNQEGKPYKKSGGKMVDGELGEMPEGWKVESLKEFVEIVNGYAYKGDELVQKGNQALVTLKSFDRNGGFQIRGFKPFIGKPKPKQEVALGDLVVSHTDLTQNAEIIGNPIVITENGGFEKMFITMDLVKVLPSTNWMDIGYLYFLMRTRNFKEHSKGYSSGTTVLHMSKKAIPEYRLVVPNDHELVKTFSVISKKLLGKLANNSSQVQLLATLRDSLLPRMMSGEVRVK